MCMPTPFTYSGGSRAKVYDENWFFVKEVPVRVRGDFIARKGDNTFSVVSRKSPYAWMSSRINVYDRKNAVTIKKPRGERL